MPAATPGPETVTLEPETPADQPDGRAPEDTATVKGPVPLMVMAVVLLYATDAAPAGRLPLTEMTGPPAGSPSW